MSQIQFRSDDTTTWGPGYGDASDGDRTISADVTETIIATTVTLSSGSKSATVGSNSGFSQGKPCLIRQEMNGGDNAGQWHLNFIVGIAGTTFTLLYDSPHNYGTTAQIIQLPQYKNLTLNAGINWTVPAFDGSIKGIIPVLVNGTLTIHGSIRGLGTNGGSTGGGGSSVSTANGGGYRGGLGSNPGYTGEGTGGASIVGSGANTTPIGSGGTNTGGSAGGGGGNANAGSASSTGGQGGLSSGTSDSITMTMGGAGSGGSAGRGSGSGGNGGAMFLAIAKNILFDAASSFKGGNGGSASSNQGRGAGSGAAGSCLFKCQTGVFGTDNFDLSAGAAGSGDEGNGGVGSIGRIHVDYSRTFTGTNTTASIDSRVDQSLDLGNFSQMI